MARLLLTGTHGPEDTTRATMPFHVARGAREAGYDVDVVLAADSPVLLKESVRDNIQGVGMPPLRELMEFASQNAVRVFV